MSFEDQYIWTERFRPHRVADVILPDSIKSKFEKYVEDGDIPPLILTGTAGIGKTTLIRAAAEEIGMDTLFINASLYGNIDTLRTDIQDFASTMSFGGKRKLVILDEADYLNPNSTQPALRNFMEEFARNCSFVMTCNNPKRIIAPLHSRASTVNFRITKKELPGVASQIMKRVCFILDTVSVPYDKKVVAALITKHLPDWRRVINELQAYSATGRIDSGILTNTAEESLKELMGFLKDRKWNEARKWVGENSDLEATDIMRQIYDTMADHVKGSSIPALVLILAKYQFQSSFAADQEVNLMACLTEILVEAEWK